MGSMGMKDEDMNGVGQESGELIQDKLSMMSMKNEKREDMVMNLVGMKDREMRGGAFAWKLMLMEK